MLTIATSRGDGNPALSKDTTPGTSEDRPASTPNSNSSIQRHPCDETICPQILSSAALNTWTESPTILLFARGANNTIWYNTANGGPSRSYIPPPVWQTWHSLDLGGPLLSQPTALTWGNGTRASVFALSDPDHMVRTLKFTDAGQTQWEDLGGPAMSVVGTCSPNSTRPDLWTTTEKEIAHNFGIGTGFNAGWSVPSSNEWPRDVSFKTTLQPTRPGVVCGESPRIHDIVMYGVDGAVRHLQFNEEAGTGLWTAPTFKGGKFIGEPAVAMVISGAVYFFGIGQDRRMYHFQWWRSTGYTELMDLGGSFKSAPSALGSRWGPRVHIVALGTNGHVHHMSVDSSNRTDWEDLGVFGNSAPLLADMGGNVLPQKVGVFVVGSNGEVNQTTLTDWNAPSWKGLVWKGIGGNMTTSFYRN
jgi:hypothetical protein